MSSVGSGGGHEERAATRRGRWEEHRGMRCASSLLAWRHPSSGEACLPLSTQITYHLSSSLAGNQERSMVGNLRWVPPLAEMGSIPYHTCGTCPL